VSTTTQRFDGRDHLRVQACRRCVTDTNNVTKPSSAFFDRRRRRCRDSSRVHDTFSPT